MVGRHGCASLQRWRHGLVVVVAGVLLGGCERGDARDAACRSGKGTACFELGAELQGACGRDCPDPKKAARIAELFRRGCDLDEARACHDLGYLYAAGVGVKKDSGQAITLYRRACDQGVPRGCSNYAWELRAGTGVDRNVPLALVYGQKACEASDGPGCCVLGKILQFEEGVIDLPRARKTFARGCTLRDGCSCDGFATMLEHGQGGPADLTRAAASYQQACTYGDVVGCGNHGVMLVKGRGVEADPVRGAAMLEKACTAGEHFFCVHLATSLLKADAGVRAEALLAEACTAGETSGCLNLGLLEERTDGLRAVERYLAACDAGDLRGCSWAGHVFLNGKNAQKDERRALGLYERACAGERPDADACFNLAWMLHGGIGGVRDLDRAFALANDLCQHDFARACVTVGGNRETGEGVPKNLDGALEAYLRACELGDGMGCSNAGVLHRDGKVKRDHARAVELFERSCALEDAWGCGNLGIQLFFGRGVARDDARALPLLAQACDDAEPDGESCFVLAQAAREGRGGKADVTRAKALEKKACGLGHKPACAH